MMSVRRVVLMAAACAVATTLHGQGVNHQLTEELLASAAAAPAQEIDRVSFQAFHDRLAPYGQWLADPRWGPVWRPNVRDGFWPYRQGHWDITRDYGTVWVSDFPWGDIPFHFGRWFYDSKRRWLWVPGYVWGPAWVIWHAGDGKIGWLAMPPWIDYDGNGEFPGNWSNEYGYADYGPSPWRFYSLWCFVDAGDLYAPSVDYYVIGPGYNARFIDRTAPWTRYSLYNGHVFNLSIDPLRFRAEFGLRIRVPKRNDFEHRLGPITDYSLGRQIEAREHGMKSSPPEAGRAPKPLPVKAQPASPKFHAPVASAASAARAPAIHAPMIHPPVTRSVPKPRVYTHTEVVPYYPSSPPRPATVPHNGTSLPTKVPQTGSAPPKGTSPGNKPH